MSLPWIFLAHVRGRKLPLPPAQSLFTRASRLHIHLLELAAPISRDPVIQVGKAVPHRTPEADDNRADCPRPATSEPPAAQRRGLDSEVCSGVALA